MSPIRNSTLLAADARNRSLRTFLPSLGIDLIVVIVAFLLPIIQDANSFGDLELALIGFSLAKTVLMTTFAFIMRRFLDPSGFPTPLPPEYPGDPADTPER